ncbi:hypothetical protein [Rheinheimera soli]|uniref:hypothetical protein n=1 Tax=Rheinheimera soli TaxID=443616 RepID=UPI001E62508B|nr:hypothetical protein [Rheinheimera soli]
MSNSVHLGFVSILLSLVMYFAFLSFHKDDVGLEVDINSKCPGTCCLTRCETHQVEVLDDQNIRFSGGLFSPEEFGSHLLQAHKECKIGGVHVLANSELHHETVLNVTNRVLGVAPNSEIIWGRVND